MKTRRISKGWSRALCLILLAFSGTAFGFSTVVIDAGHGGHDVGGIPGQRVSEKNMALDVARRVRSRLSEAGLRTVMTRNGDYFVPLNTRVAVAGAQRNAIFVSIHFNSTPTNRYAEGIETYYYSPRAASLAARIHGRVVAAAGTGDRGVRRRAFYVLRKNRVPAVLVECGFLTSSHEARLVQSSAHRQRIANAIANAVIASRGY